MSPMECKGGAYDISPFVYLLLVILLLFCTLILFSEYLNLLYSFDFIPYLYNNRNMWNKRLYTFSTSVLCG